MIELNPLPPHRSLLPSFFHHHEWSGADNTWDEESEDIGLENATERLNLGADAPTDSSPPQQTAEDILKELYASSDFRHDIYISLCVNRDIAGLQQLFEMYPDDNFISHVCDEGSNGVLYAATEENGLATVQWLEEQGAEIDRVNHYGRTPLMEAALWGRLETVRYLTAQGVDLGTRDGNGMNALELAADSQRNSDERASRAGSVYREPANANHQRALIEHQLRRLCNAPIQGPTASPPSPRGFSFFQRTADGNLVVYRPQNLLQVPLGQGQKAFGELDRGPSYPLVNAMSGYSHSAWPNILDNNLWATRANELRRYLGLPLDISFASHVEPQLLTYLVSHHNPVRFTDQDREVEQEVLQDLFDSLSTFRLTPIITVNKSRISALHVCSSLTNSSKGSPVSERSISFRGRECKRGCLDQVVTKCVGIDPCSFEVCHVKEDVLTGVGRIRKSVDNMIICR